MANLRGQLGSQSDVMKKQLELTKTQESRDSDAPSTRRNSYSILVGDLENRGCNAWKPVKDDREQAAAESR
jgi:hypothetical protein